MPFLSRLFLATALCCAASLAQSRSFPNNPVRVVIGFPSGGGIDIVARILAPKLSEALGQQVVIDSRLGANGVVGMDAAAKAPAEFGVFLKSESATWTRVIRQANIKSE